MMADASQMVRRRCALFLVLATPICCIAQTEETGAVREKAFESVAANPVKVLEAEIKPRLELYIPSIDALLGKTKQSHSGVFVRSLGELLGELATASAEGVDADQADAIVGQIANWPDTSVGVFIYAADREGRQQWAVRLSWPAVELRKRLASILELDATAEMFEGLRIEGNEHDVVELKLGESSLAHLRSMGNSHTLLSSHPDLPIPTEANTGISEPTTAETPLITCRLNFVGTEKDSGATFLSSFSAVTDIEYSGHVNPEGDWVERIQVHWPPISGMGAKTVFGKVKQTFFAPGEAFGAFVFNTMMAPGMLDGMAGFGQQVVMGPSGEMTIVGEAEIGPITSYVEPELCVTLLPGTGFLPAPDIIIQGRTKRVEQLIEGIRKAAKSANKACRQRDWSEPWHEIKVRDRAVFWSEGGQQYPGVMMPLTYRPVLFTTKEVDARDRERDFLLLGWTSTSPDGLVRRWLDLPRSKDRRYLPEQRKTHGQLWVNWKQLYKWVSPYVNVPVGALATVLPLPDMDEVESDMTDAIATAKMGYAGLSLSHTGPVPVGTLFVPVSFGVAASVDNSGDSDVARERLACRCLKVLYHHAKLFKQDMGRWPAEVAELDGYVDFAGHPGLLKLQLSSRKRWSEWFEGLLKPDDDQKGDDEDEFEDERELETDLYVIEWGRDAWRLKLAPDKLEHLEDLYIDQDGKIHRREKQKKEEKDEVSKGETNGEEVTVAAVLKQAAQNVADRYDLTPPPSETE